MKRVALPTRMPERLLAGVVLLGLAVLFWKLRIFDSGVNPTIEIGPIDLYIEVTPMNAYGFGALKHGSVPLWNPYQFCGEPFLAMAYVGLFYPPHFVNLFFDVLTSFEISLILHMFFGGASMWSLCRHFRIGMLGGLCAAVTFMWSGMMILNNTLPGVFEAMTWMPLTVLLLDHVCAGRRRAWFWLLLALTCQLLIGLPEVVLHTLLVSGVFALGRLVQMGRHGSWRAGVRGIAVSAACGVGALCLAAPQLLPAIELTQQSARAAGTLTFEQAAHAAIPPLLFLRAAVQTKGAVTVGLLPLLGLALALGARRHRLVAIAALVAAVGAALLVFGGPAYRVYYGIPVIGSMFRRPMKFLDVYAFAQALIVGVAVTRLEGWRGAARATLWRQPAWLGALGIGAVALAWLAWAGGVWWEWATALGLLLVFGSVPWPAVRIAAVVGLCILQGANLFFTTGDKHVRPIQRPEIFYSSAELLGALKRNLGDGRVYLSPKFWFSPGLTAKQGLLMKMPVVTDYEPLAVGRYERFFAAVSPRPAVERLAPFAGDYNLEPTSHWRLMDLTGTTYFVMLRGEPGDLYMLRHPAEFYPVYDYAQVRVFERRSVLPRAYFVSRARTLAGAAAVLAGLDTPSFDPRAEVLFEAGDAEASPPASGGLAAAQVRITSYAPERVEISANVGAPGFLVLADLHYPGWRAFVGDREVPIHYANYLFRAVRLEAGRSEVRFVFRPRSFYIGLVLCAAAAAAIAALLVWTAVARRRLR